MPTVIQRHIDPIISSERAGSETVFTGNSCLIFLDVWLRYSFKLGLRSDFSGSLWLIFEREINIQRGTKSYH